MKHYNVHLYREVQILMDEIEADTAREAADKAAEICDVTRSLNRGAFEDAGTFSGAVVDPIIEAEDETSIRGVSEEEDNSEFIDFNPPVFTPAERGAVLAGLRMWQEVCGNFDTDTALDDIATQDGTVTALTPDEIDALCERINLGEV